MNNEINHDGQQQQPPMRSFLGHTRVLAMPMTREDAEKRLGEKIDDGFLVQEGAGEEVRERWLPADSFRQYFLPMEFLSFGRALDATFWPKDRSKPVRVARDSWDSGWVIGKNAPGKDGRFCKVWAGDVPLSEGELCQELTCEDMTANDWRVIDNG